MADIALHDRIDAAELFLVEQGWRMCGPGENPDGIEIVHRFTPGLYTRECRMQAGHLFISKIHKSEHPFVISAGDVSVFEGEKARRLTAPHTGVTLPGTRRILITHAFTIWTTFHVTSKTDPVEVERDIIEERENLLLSGHAPEQLRGAA